MQSDITAHYLHPVAYNCEIWAVHSYADIVHNWSPVTQDSSEVMCWLVYLVAVLNCYRLKYFWWLCRFRLVLVISVSKNFDWFWLLKYSSMSCTLVLRPYLVLEVLLHRFCCSVRSAVTGLLFGRGCYHWIWFGELWILNLVYFVTQFLLWR
jgi:hypothetical protein